MPVQVLLPVGGNRTLRGAPQDRYLDMVSGIANLELRFPIYKRLGGIIAMDAGRVWKRTSEINFHNWAYAPAAGLRYYFDTFVVRFDLGFGNESTGVYFNINHIISLSVFFVALHHSLNE